MRLSGSSLDPPGGHQLLGNNFHEYIHGGGQVLEQEWLATLYHRDGEKIK